MSRIHDKYSNLNSLDDLVSALQEEMAKGAKAKQDFEDSKDCIRWLKASIKANLDKPSIFDGSIYDKGEIEIMGTKKIFNQTIPDLEDNMFKKKDEIIKETIPQNNQNNQDDYGYYGIVDSGMHNNTPNYNATPNNNYDTYQIYEQPKNNQYNYQNEQYQNPQSHNLYEQNFNEQNFAQNENIRANNYNNYEIPRETNINSQQTAQNNYNNIELPQENYNNQAMNSNYENYENQSFNQMPQENHANNYEIPVEPKQMSQENFANTQINTQETPSTRENSANFEVIEEQQAKRDQTIESLKKNFSNFSERFSERLKNKIKKDNPDFEPINIKATFN